MSDPSPTRPSGERWLNAVVQITQALDLPPDATQEQREQAVTELMDQCFPAGLEVVASGRVELVEEGTPVSSEDAMLQVQAMRRLAARLAQSATFVPGGTRWPALTSEWTAPDANYVAIVVFEGGLVVGRGETMEQARADLEFELLFTAQNGQPPAVVLEREQAEQVRRTVAAARSAFVCGEHLSEQLDAEFGAALSALRRAVGREQ